MAINLVRLGRMDEARAQAKLMLEKNDPKFSQAKWRQGYFYSDPSIVEGEVEAFRANKVGRRRAREHPHRRRPPNR